MTVNDVYNRCSCVHVPLLTGGFQPRRFDDWTWRIERAAVDVSIAISSASEAHVPAPIRHSA